MRREASERDRYDRKRPEPGEWPTPIRPLTGCEPVPAVPADSAVPGRLRRSAVPPRGESEEDGRLGQGCCHPTFGPRRPADWPGSRIFFPRSDQVTGTKASGVEVGWLEPPLGSTDSATSWASSMSVSSVGVASTDEPMTPADRMSGASGSSMYHS